jgi:hypothetical protein
MPLSSGRGHHYIEGTTIFQSNTAFTSLQPDTDATGLHSDADATSLQSD